MSLSTVQLTEKEKLIFYHANKVPYVTAKSVCEQFPQINYSSATRFLSSLTRKGYLVNKGRHNDGNRFETPNVQKAEGHFQIPFKGDTYYLEDLLLYVTQEIEDNDFQKYGQVISAGVYHLVFRAIQYRQDIPLSGPSPLEVKQLLHNALKPYKDVIDLVELILQLPIYDLNDDVLKYFYDVNEQYLIEREQQLFQPFWNQGVIGTHGLRDKFHITLKKLKERFKVKYNG